MENKRVHDLYCSLIFKGKALCISYGYKMLIGMPEGPVSPQAAPCD